MLGRGDRDGRMAALTGPDSQHGVIQPASHQAQNPRRAGASVDSAGARDVGEEQLRDDAAAVNLTGSAADGPQGNRREGRAQPAARVVDRGAAQVIDMMKEALGAGEAENFRTSIAIRALRNQSRTPSQEIEDLRDRLVALLDASSEDGSLRFTREVGDETEYTLGATVYLIQRDGFDQWEIYFALRPVDANWTIWRNEEPVRTLRQKRANDRDSMQVVPAR